MAAKNGPTTTLDPRRNQTVERKKLFEEMLLKDLPGTARTNEPMHAVLEGELHESNLQEGKESQNVRNRALLQYSATLANSNSRDDTFDFDFVQSLLNNGADVNSTDKTGQTVFHEVARSWNIDVASFLIKNGANVNQQDQYGRSPLHVAAAVDYAEMVEFLLENGADIDIKTSGEGQAPIHFAAKNDAINSLQMLLGYGANIDARDNKNRTPLQVSAEMNRSKAAKLLISEGAPAGVYDNLGNSALSLLIEKIPEVALDAMDQFHSVDTINRKEFYFLNYLEGTKLRKEKTPARTPLEIAVHNERFDIIMHPVMQRLIGVKWKIYGKWKATLDLVLNLVYTVLWTVLAVTLPDNGRDLYTPLGRNSWRVIIVILLIVFTIQEMRKQIVNTSKTRKELKNWREWRAAELERDLAYCHPRWPQEAQYLSAEIKAVRNLSLISGSDWWIYFDWAALVLILATIASHVTFFHYSNDTSKEVHHYITIPLLLMLWFRIFKYARPFESAGPFIVIFASVLGDIVKWGFLNSIIVIPFTCAFWITFGSISLNPVSGYNSVGPLLYNIFSMMVVNNHDYDKLEEANPVMARLLCGSFIGIAAIVTLNLLIALLTNTFERHYENAVANAVMQRARTILLLQKSLRKSKKKNYYDFIKTNGSPEVIVKTLGRLLTMDGDDRGTIERVRDDVKIIVGILGEKFGKKFGKGKKSDLDFVKMDVSKIRRFQDELITDVKNMKQAFREITEKLEEMNNNHGRHMEQALQEIVIKIEEMNNNNASETKQVSQEIIQKIEEIKLCNNSNENQQGIGKTSEEHSDDLEKESCDDDSDDESNATYNRHTKLTKLKTGSERSDHNEQTKTPTKTKYKGSDFAGEGVGGEKGTMNQQLSYLHQPSSTFPDKMLLHNNPFDNAPYAYPPHRHPGSLNYDDPRNMENLTIKTYDQIPYGNNQWFSPNRRDVTQHHKLSYPAFQQRQDMGQQYGYEPILPNFNQFSSHDTRQPTQPTVRYFDRRFPHTHAHHDPIENTRLFQSAPYVKQPLTTNRFQRPPATQEPENFAYGYENYGFQPNDEDIIQDVSTGFRPLAVNSPFTYGKYEQPRKMMQPSVSPLSHEVTKPEYTPTTKKVAPVRQTYEVKYIQPTPRPTLPHPVSSSAVQKHDNLHHSIPRTVVTQSSSVQIQVRPPQRNKVFTTEMIQDETEGQTKESPHSQTTEDLIEAAEEAGKAQTSPIQPVPEQPTTSVYDDTELQLVTEDECDVPQSTLTQEGQLAPENGENWYNEYRPSTPIAPQIMDKVVLFEGERLIESTDYDESSTTEFTKDSTKVPTQSNVESHYSSTDDPQKTEEETDKTTSTEESHVQEQDTVEDQRDVPIPLSPRDLEMDVENETNEEIFSEETEEDFPNVVFSPLQAEIKHAQDSPSDT